MSPAEPDPSVPAGKHTGTPRYHLLLPHKEKFSPANAGAVATIAADLVRSSKKPQAIRIFGTAVDTPFQDCNFSPLGFRTW